MIPLYKELSNNLFWVVAESNNAFLISGVAQKRCDASSLNNLLSLKAKESRSTPGMTILLKSFANAKLFPFAKASSGPLYKNPFSNPKSAT